jgi:hypothetical protein
MERPSLDSHCGGPYPTIEVAFDFNVVPMSDQLFEIRSG